MKIKAEVLFLKVRQKTPGRPAFPTLTASPPRTIVQPSSEFVRRDILEALQDLNAATLGLTCPAGECENSRQFQNHAYASATVFRICIYARSGQLTRRATLRPIPHYVCEDKPITFFHPVYSLSKSASLQSTVFSVQSNSPHRSPSPRTSPEFSNLKARIETYKDQRRDMGGLPLEALPTVPREGFVGSAWIAIERVLLGSF